MVKETPCDFCSEHHAVLYCRADSARLCLFCDHQVHSANLLSRKHSRSLICDNCGWEPVTVRCATDKLALCQECDWDAHGSCSVSANHERSPVEGFTGCPSAIELASVWDFAISKDEEDEAKQEEEKRQGDARFRGDWTGRIPNNEAAVSMHIEAWGTPFGDVIVPNSIDCEYGKHKRIFYRQLVKLHEMNCGKEISGDGGNMDDHIREVAKDEKPACVRAEKQPVVRTKQRKESDLNFVSPAESKLDGRCIQEMDNASMTTGNGTQIWDFNSGTLRNHHDPEKLEASHDAGDNAMKMKDLDSTSSSFWLNSSPPHEDIIFFSNSARKSTAQGASVSESSNLSLLAFAAPKAAVDGPPFLLGGDSMKVMAGAVDVALMAKNRGNAMQRYKEKKKNRRYEKQVRYESRKVRADNRKRVKGRFVKSSDA